MNATINAAARCRNQVVILNGLRPGAKLQTSKPARRLSTNGRFALQMLGILLSGALSLGCIVMHSLTDSPWWVLGLVVCWLPMALDMLNELSNSNNNQTNKKGE